MARTTLVARNTTQAQCTSLGRAARPRWPPSRVHGVQAAVSHASHSGAPCSLWTCRTPHDLPYLAALGRSCSCWDSFRRLSLDTGCHHPLLVQTFGCLFLLRSNLFFLFSSAKMSEFVSRKEQIYNTRGFHETFFGHFITLVYPLLTLFSSFSPQITLNDKIPLTKN